MSSRFVLVLCLASGRPSFERLCSFTTETVQKESVNLHLPAFGEAFEASLRNRLILKVSLHLDNGVDRDVTSPDPTVKLNCYLQNALNPLGVACLALSSGTCDPSAGSVV